MHKKVTLSVLSGHSDEIVGAYFGKDGNNVFTITGDGGVFPWRYDKIETNNNSSKMSESDT